MKEISLPSGKTATIKEGKGKDSQLALRMCGGDSSKYLSALMSVLCEIDGAKLVMEDIEELPLRDYNTLMAEFSELNF
jgi:hypothetical protein